MQIDILYPSTGAARAAIEELRKKMSSLDRSGVIYLQMEKNERELMMADELVYTTKADHQGEEEYTLRVLQTLEDWMLHRRKELGALEIFVQLRILNTHLLIQFYERYR
jgi:hypothetical protein